jgi:hypothetical protein
MHDISRSTQCTAQALAPCKKHSTTEKAGLCALTRDDDDSELAETHLDTAKLWRDEYNGYRYEPDIVTDGEL